MIRFLWWLVSCLVVANAVGADESPLRDRTGKVRPSAATLRQGYP